MAQQGILSGPGGLPLALGIGILSNLRPTRYKQNFLTSIGPGLGAGLQMYAASQPQPQSELDQLRLEQLRAQLEMQRQQQRARDAFRDTLPEDKRAQFDVDPDRFMAGYMAPPKPPTTRTRNLPDGTQQLERWDPQAGQFVPDGPPTPRWQPDKGPQVVVQGDIPPPMVDPQTNQLVVWDAQAQRYVPFMTSPQAAAPGTAAPSGVQSAAEKSAGQDMEQAGLMAGVLQEAEQYKDLFTYEGKAKQLALRVREKMGGTPSSILARIGMDPSLSDEDKEWLGGARRLQERVEQIFNRYRSEITGAAASVAEIERLRDTMLNMDLTWSEFKASAEMAARRMQLAMEVKQSMYGTQNLKLLNKAQWQRLDQAIQQAWSEDEQANAGTASGQPAQPPTQDERPIVIPFDDGG